MFYRPTYHDSDVSVSTCATPTGSWPLAADNNSAKHPGCPDFAGRYHLAEQIGAGATSTVCRAFDTLYEKQVAIKLLRRELLHDVSLRARFQKEAKLLVRLSHPHVVAISSYGEHDGLSYIALEYVDGGNLESMTADRPLDPDAATGLCIQACRGVREVHAAGILHLDLKPANFIVASSGIVKLADFGLAIPITRHPFDHEQAFVAGTPSFMSPEQCTGAALDERADVYALGATYFALLTGTKPYADRLTASDIMHAHVHAEPPDPRMFVPGVPDACAAIVRRALAKRPDERYQTIDDVLSTLEALLAGRHPVADAQFDKPRLDRPRSPRVRSDLRGHLAFTACATAVLLGFTAMNALFPPRLRITESAPIVASSAAVSVVESSDTKHAQVAQRPATPSEK